MSKVNVLVMAGYGLNCDHETAYAFELAGAEAVRVHINSLIDGTVNLDSFPIMVFVAGFSWGADGNVLVGTDAGLLREARARRLRRATPAA